MESFYKKYVFSEQFSNLGHTLITVTIYIHSIDGFERRRNIPHTGDTKSLDVSELSSPEALGPQLEQHTQNHLNTQFNLVCMTRWKDLSGVGITTF